MNIYMICTLWTPFQAERDWKSSYREISKFPSNIYYILFGQAIFTTVPMKRLSDQLKKIPSFLLLEKKFIVIISPLFWIKCKKYFFSELGIEKRRVSNKQNLSRKILQQWKVKIFFSVSQTLSRKKVKTCEILRKNCANKNFAKTKLLLICFAKQFPHFGVNPRNESGFQNQNMLGHLQLRWKTL